MSQLPQLRNEILRLGASNQSTLFWVRSMANFAIG